MKFKKEELKMIKEFAARMKLNEETVTRVVEDTINDWSPGVEESLWSIEAAFDMVNEFVQIG